MVFSMGAEVYADGATRFDSPEALKVFQIYEALTKEQLAFQIPPGTYDDEVALAQDRIAFVFRSSSGRANVAELMRDEQDKWGMAMIPQGDPDDPHTVLFGPNICIFNTTPEQQEAAWEFVKFFTSLDGVVQWALGTGYLPIRKSAAKHPKMQAFWGEWEYNRAGFDCLPYARPEPNVAGWQEVRGLVEDALTAVLTDIKSAEQASRELKRAADRALSDA
jgi:ABC-type glycerol-3-phosphate transport system substrate-binding protein